ncbi:MAG: PEP-CTERM sorting domain-containing protein [Phenylobacterium sp.]|uniref:PEPxxWA-CTERM sorting domain-containing protein n=1 Tax=Phenylobacterium sp. TaxID=1871053 RepID=UPI0025D39DFE|nr:PEPxxWA-CTERM sorting domain-containing protein [Phenylobacterium sp.]MBI1199954.1 PEP-CTERM sorting domain-containing protein [Phenylobacterium sp.]
MRLSGLVAAAALSFAATQASAAVMVAHFEGTIGGIGGNGNFSDRFGFPILHVFTGPFVAEFVYDTATGSNYNVGPGGEGLNGAVQAAWIEFEGVHIDLGGIEYSQVAATSTGFSVHAQHYIPNEVNDTLSFIATFAGATGDLDAPLPSIDPTNATGEGHFQAVSNYSSRGWGVDIDGGCTAYYCAGMPLQLQSFRIAEYTPDAGAGGVPEPATWALMILGFGGAGGMLRRRRTALA